MINLHPMRGYRIAAGALLLFVLALHSFGLRAELLFRSVEQVNGQQRWSPLRKYVNPSDTAYASVSAGRAAARAEVVRVFVSGSITREDVEGAAVMAGLLASGRQRIAGNSVWFASNGGDIDAALELGRRLRDLGVFTLVARNDQCMSACVFAFMGGERRRAAGRIGIHRPFFPFTQDLPDRQSRFRHLQQTLKDYIDELDFPASLYEAVMEVPPESMRILAPAELKRFYLEGISPSSEDAADAAAARRLNISMANYLKIKAKETECVFPLTDDGRCVSDAQEMTASGSAMDDPGRPRDGEAALSGRAVGRGTEFTEEKSLGTAIPHGAKHGAPGS